MRNENRTPTQICLRTRQQLTCYSRNRSCPEESLMKVSRTPSASAFKINIAPGESVSAGQSRRSRHGIERGVKRGSQERGVRNGPRGRAETRKTLNKTGQEHTLIRHALSNIAVSVQQAITIMPQSRPSNSHFRRKSMQNDRLLRIHPIH